MGGFISLKGSYSWDPRHDPPPSSKCHTTGTQTLAISGHMMFVSLLPIQLNECQLVFAKMPRLEPNQTPRQMFLMREERPGRTVSGKISVLHAYIIRGVFVCEPTTCAGRTPCFRYSLKNNHLQQAALGAGSGSAGLFSVHGTGWRTESSAGAGHCNVLQCSALHTHSASDNLSISCSISQPLLPILGSFLSQCFLSSCPFFSSLRKLFCSLTLRNTYTNTYCNLSLASSCSGNSCICV